jgi:redox-sensitive bicupin YhaK (pirin superfamily)
MEEDFKRRNFLTRITLLGGALVSVPFHNMAKSIKQSLSSMSEKTNPILNIKPLGFQWETQDPFLFCVHHEDYFPKGNENMAPDKSFLQGRHLGDDFIIKDGFRMYHGKTVPGFPGHPHRGFETITVVRKGLVDHADSLGAAGRYGDGDVQWMTAGKGVQHSEMFPLIYQNKENTMELFQIWLNLPKKDKMVDPHFKMLWRESIPNYKHTDGNAKNVNVEVITGELLGLNPPAPPPNSWAANPSNEVAVWNIKMEQGSKWILPKATKGINRTLYFYEGDDLILSGNKIDKYHAVQLKAEFDVELIASTETSILILQGKPIDEPVMQYGPFVMNTKAEINQAFEDYHQTQFGGWPWPRYDQVHDRSKTRFAKHADGKLEIKEV